MNQLFYKKNALLVSALSFLLSLIVFAIANFVLLGYDRELVVAFELTPFALFASLVIFGLIMTQRRIGFSLFLTSFLIACALMLFFFSQRDNAFATLTGSLMYIYIILIGAIISVLIDLIVSWRHKNRLKKHND
jgi:hypothetical protein